jgi:hypothetical protein
MAPPVIRIWRGATRPVAWRLQTGDGNLFDLTGSTFRLSVAAAGVVLIAKDSEASDGLVIDVSQATVTWTPSLVESRLIPLGRLASYELERRIGDDQEIVAWGQVEGLGGINADT